LIGSPMKSDTRLLRVTRENSSRASSLDQQVRIEATVVILLMASLSGQIDGSASRQDIKLHLELNT
jgi:hypothetical protein